MGKCKEECKRKENDLSNLLDFCVTKAYAECGIAATKYDFTTEGHQGTQRSVFQPKSLK
jgi:hypothetical protein